MVAAPVDNYPDGSHPLLCCNCHYKLFLGFFDGEKMPKSSGYCMERAEMGQEASDPIRRQPAHEGCPVSTSPLQSRGC